MQKYARQYRSLGDGAIATAMRRTVNDAAHRKGKPLMVDAAMTRGQWDRKTDVRKRVKAYNAHSGGMVSKVVATQRHYSLVDKFKARGATRAGRAFTGAAPWGKSRTYKSGFYISSKFGNYLIPVTRVGKGRNAYKVLYGPSVPREVELELKESGRIMAEIRDYAKVRAAHHFSYAAQVAKSRAGL